MDSAQEITRLLNHPTRSSEEDERLFALVYAELHAVARAMRARWSGNETMGATVLVHEAWLRVGKAPGQDWDSRKHFYVVAARAMRQILLNYAERARAAKRTPAAGASEPVLPWTPEESLAIHEALEALEELDARKARVVELKFFADLTNEEIAEELQISPITVKRDWAFARSWLAQALS